MAVPRKPDREVVKPVVVKVSISPRQREIWEARAKHLGMPMLEWLREVAAWDARLR